VENSKSQHGGVEGRDFAINLSFPTTVLRLQSNQSIQSNQQQKILGVLQGSCSTIFFNIKQNFLI
jgi:hypothetical protein